jgi:hypothetical protein
MEEEMNVDAEVVELEGVNSQVVLSVGDAITYTIYISNFLQEYDLSELSLEQQKIELLQKDWLCSGLIHEIELLFPSQSEIKANDDNKRDPLAFQQKISQLFSPGHFFASFKQLDQVADIFLGVWAVKKIHNSKSICCAYSRTRKKKDRKHIDLSKRQKLEPTLKSVYKCPFTIRYSFVAYCKNKALKKPDIFYHVKITQVNYQHTCQMSRIFHRQALQKPGGL